MRDVRRHVINAKRPLALLRCNCPTRLLGVCTLLLRLQCAPTTRQVTGHSSGGVNSNWASSADSETTLNPNLSYRRPASELA